MVRSLSEYGHIFMIATGIGIAAQIPYIKELLDGQRKGVVKTQKITLIWELDLARTYARDMYTGTG
jgi:NAD(P)H-flavin reductase